MFVGHGNALVRRDWWAFKLVVISNQALLNIEMSAMI